MTSETQRRQTNREKVLAHLQLWRTARNVDLVTIGGMRAMGRVHELQHAGYDIAVTHERGGVWRVTYHGRKPDAPLLRMMA